jgi:predicted dehydrogenase
MTYKMAIVGASGHAHLALDDLPRLPQVQFAACAPSFPGEDMSRVLAGRDGDVHSFDNWQQMLDTVEPDIVVSCGRNDTLGLVAIEAAQRGCHVFSEKPAAHSLEELATLRQAVDEAGVVYTMMLPIRYQPAYWTARSLVEQGVIGEPVLVTGQKSYRWGGQRPAWYAQREHYGSTMAWVGVHAFDYARWVSGRRFVEVFGYHDNLVHTERPGCQDVSTVIASLDNGGSALFNLDYLRPDAAPTHGDDRLRVAGSSGVLEVCDAGTRLEVITSGDGGEHVRAWPLEQTERTLMTDLVGVLDGDGSLLVTAEEAFDITAFALCAAQAADEHRIVRL